MNLTTKATMTSLEIVQVINSMRGEGESELRHDNFMAKVPKVLGELIAPKFLGGNKFVNGKGGTQERAIYNLPKREAILMVGSYSYAVQAAIYDRMTELELQLEGVKINAT